MSETIQNIMPQILQFAEQNPILVIALSAFGVVALALFVVLKSLPPKNREQISE